MPDVADVKIYLVGAAAILDEYPGEVGTMLADPRTGTRLLKPFPSLHDLRAACDNAYEPIEREIERNRAAQSHRLGLSAPTKADQQRRDEQMADYESRIKPVLMAAIKPILTARVEAKSDGKHFDRIKADLEARRVRNEQMHPPKESSAA